MRICSLLPSATEIVFALGQGTSLVGVTHECDYPPEAASLPHVTRTNIPAGLSSHEIDASVSSTLVTAGSLYELDLPLLERLRPDLILTQRLCEVCAVSSDRVEQSVDQLSSHPRVLNLEPHSLDDILSNIRTVAEVIGCDAEGLLSSLRQRIDAVVQKTRVVSSRPRVFCMEWADPPYCGGHWMSELVEMAGGRDELAKPHRPSQRIEWSRVVEYAPEVIVLTCCGFSLDRNMQEAQVLSRHPELAARVYATDGSAYFSRPGPRIVDSLEILAHLIHPELFSPPCLPHAFSPVDLRVQ
ncbi:MAG: cobalamin-binding protein [Acidobacteria bacterium]|nr:cobalamin-binding protein [Acidobacteriota bacterium]